MKYGEAEKQQSWVHSLVYGEAGSGKSTLVSKLAEKHKIYWISCDNGHRVLSKLSPAAKENIDILIIPDNKETPVARDTIYNLLKGRRTTFCETHGIVACAVCMKNKLAFNTWELNKIDSSAIVVIDHLTRVTDSIIAQITKGKPDDYKLQLDDWGSLRYHISALLSYVQTARFNVICIAGITEGKDEAGEKKLYPSVGSSEFGHLVGQYFDDVIYCHMLNQKHRFGSSSTYANRALAKSRVDFAIENLTEASLEKLFEFTTVGSYSPATVADAGAKQLLQGMQK